MGIPSYEQETVIVFARDDDKAEIYTSDTTMMTKFDKKLSEECSQWQLLREAKLGGEIISKTYLVDRKLISFRSKKIDREYTEEERKMIGEKLRQGRLQKQKNM